MADLMGGSAHAPTSNGNGGHASRRPTAGPQPTGSPSGIRGPRMIMQERAAREARQRAEAEQQQLERARAEQEAQLLEQARKRNAERRPAGVAATSDSAEPGAQVPAGHNTHGRTSSSGAQHQKHQNNPTNMQAQDPQTSGSRYRSNSRTQQQTPQQSYQNATQAQAQPAQPNQAQQSTTVAQTGEPSLRDSGSSKPRNSFPHAFERWETLSAHWEGLTSYWIRKLEQNKDDINRDPVSQQLARQVTDLSAAGANLFHAVVELQRLRASSERKFQRWFFETRAELERAQENNGQLEMALEQERRDRADAIRGAVDHERDTSKAQQQLAEMRKELAISKEEARRAWEELGRRENEERERTLSLQAGNPTVVGGVQVVPMLPGVTVRHSSANPEQQQQQQQQYSQGSAQEPQDAPPVQRQAQSEAPPEAYYRSQDPAGHASSRRPSGHDDGSDGEYLMDAHGNFVLDMHGRKIPFNPAPSTLSGSDAEDYDTPATTNPPSGATEQPKQQYPPPQAPQPPPPGTSAGSAQWTGAYSSPQDYSGQGYGAPGWETVPRHHHPTRLSDVIEEEDERSRASTSHFSRGPPMG